MLSRAADSASSARTLAICSVPEVQPAEAVISTRRAAALTRMAILRHHPGQVYREDDRPSL
jgi:hypothetical protein